MSQFSLVGKNEVLLNKVRLIFGNLIGRPPYLGDTAAMALQIVYNIHQNNISQDVQPIDLLSLLAEKEPSKDGAEISF